MNSFVHNDIVSFNFYYRNKLKNSLTYSIYNGYFNNIRHLLESNENNSSLLDLNETDEWWADSSSINRKNNNSINKSINNLTIVLPLVRHNSAATNKSFSRSNTYSLEQFNPNKKIKTIGRTALMLCSLIEDDSWSYGIAQNLIEKGALLNLKDSNGHNALMYACFYQRTNLLELILNASCDYDLLSKDKFGNTVFHLASLGQNENYCNILHKICLKYNIDLSNILVKNKLGHTPYDLCKMNGHESCLRNLYPSLTNRKLDTNLPDSGMIDSKRQETCNGTIQENKSENFLKTLVEENIKLDYNLSESNFIKEIAPLNINIDSKSLNPSVSTRESDSNSLASTARKSSNSSKSIIYDCYKSLLMLKEPFIKPNISLLSKESKLKLKSDLLSSNLPSLRDNCKRSKSVVVRPTNKKELETYMQGPKLDLKLLNRENFEHDRINNTHSNDKNFDSVESASQHGDYHSSDQCQSWRENMKKLFDTIELQNSQSYRRTNTNLATNLFEQLSSGIFLNVQINPIPEQMISRRNSIFRKQNHSSMSTHSNDRRQSSISILKNIKTTVQRRTSVTSNH